MWNLIVEAPGVTRFELRLAKKNPPQISTWEWELTFHNSFSCVQWIKRRY